MLEATTLMGDDTLSDERCARCGDLFHAAVSFWLVLHRPQQLQLSSGGGGTRRLYRRHLIRSAHFCSSCVDPLSNGVECIVCAEPIECGVRSVPLRDDSTVPKTTTTEATKNTSTQRRTTTSFAHYACVSICIECDAVEYANQSGKESRADECMILALWDDRYERMPGSRRMICRRCYRECRVCREPLFWRFQRLGERGGGGYDTNSMHFDCAEQCSSAGAQLNFTRHRIEQ